MRSFILPLAVLATSVLAAPKPYDDCTTKGNTVIEYYDVTITETLYVTKGAEATHSPHPYTTKRKTHTHKSHHYAPAPTGYVITITEGAPAPPAYTPPPPVYNSPAPTKAAPPPQNYGSMPEDTGDYKTDAINYHNYWRQRHGAQPLTWSDDLANYAAGNTGSCQMQHTGGPYGENLAMGTSLDAHEGIQMWYDEGKDWQPGMGFQENTGHYTQVIWKGSQQIGCYLQNCGDQNYLMCEYSPPGNVDGGYDDNCGPLDSGINAGSEYN